MAFLGPWGGEYVLRLGLVLAEDVVVRAKRLAEVTAVAQPLHSKRR